MLKPLLLFLCFFFCFKILLLARFFPSDSSQTLTVSRSFRCFFTYFVSMLSHFPFLSAFFFLFLPSSVVSLPCLFPHSLRLYVLSLSTSNLSAFSTFVIFSFSLFFIAFHGLSFVFFVYFNGCPYGCYPFVLLSPGLLTFLYSSLSRAYL